MAEECQYLEYRSPADESGDGGAGTACPDESEADGAEDRQPRAYCTAADQFVQAMRADICNRRYGLDPETDCEIYRDYEALPTVPEGEGAKTRGTRADDAGGD
jgi:hypothetical protein